MLQWVALHYKILDKQSNLRASLEVAQKVFSPKKADKLPEELLCTREKIVIFRVLTQ